MSTACALLCCMMLPLPCKTEATPIPTTNPVSFQAPCHQISYLAPRNSLGREMKKGRSSKHTENSILLRTAIQSTRLCVSDILITENNSFLLQAPWHISTKFLVSRPLQFQFYSRTHAPQHGQLSSMSMMAKFNSL